RQAVPRCRRGGDAHARTDRDHRRLHRLPPRVLPGGGRRVNRGVPAGVPVRRHPVPVVRSIQRQREGQGLRCGRHRGGVGHDRRRLLRAGPTGHHRPAHAPDRGRGPGSGVALQDPRTGAHRRRRGAGPRHFCSAIRRPPMKWVTRERARVDRIACPWLITRFIDPKPEFLFVPAKDVMAVASREQAIPYDVPNVELGHRGPRGSFDPFVERYELLDPALLALATIVRGADTDDRALTPESAGLYAAATGFQATSRDDFDNMSRQFPMYDAFYEYSRVQTASIPPQPRVLFVCLHGAAKSVVAAAHFRRLASARGLSISAVAAGTEPDAEVAAGGGEGGAG